MIDRTTQKTVNGRSPSLDTAHVFGSVWQKVRLLDVALRLRLACATTRKSHLEAQGEAEAEPQNRTVKANKTQHHKSDRAGGSAA